MPSVEHKRGNARRNTQFEGDRRDKAESQDIPHKEVDFTGTKR